MLDQRLADKPLAKGLDAVWDAGVGLAKRCVPRLRRFLERAEAVLEFEKQFADMSNAQLQEAIEPLRETFRRQSRHARGSGPGLRPVREVAMRQIGERPFAVQVAGALALEAGCIAEMATGEGKTLTATMPATIAGWRGRGCHVITVNDYLAKRDAEWMGRIYHFCGLTVAHVEQGMARRGPPSRLPGGHHLLHQQGSHRRLPARPPGAGPLRRPVGGAARSASPGRGGRRWTRLVQRGLHYAIVDEADSVLIDEAVTPLIISGDGPQPRAGAGLPAGGRPGRAVAGAERLQRQPALPRGGPDRRRARSAWRSWPSRSGRPLERRPPPARSWSVKALTAREFYRRDKQYVVDEGKVVIVDEFTGRLMPDREWRDGLHQAVEAKERVEVTPPKDTYARISFQRFFRLYRKLAGMTGTAQEATAEFWQIYHLPVVVIPDQPPVHPAVPARPGLRHRSRQVAGDRRGDRPRARDGPADAGRHAQRPRQRAPQPAADGAGPGAPGAQRRPPRRGGPDRRPGRAAGQDHRGHEHGRARHGHQAGPGRRRASAACT